MYSGSCQVFWVCGAVVGISSLRDEKSMDIERVFVCLGQKVIDEGVVGAVVRVCSIADMGKKGLAGEVVMDVSLVVLFNFVWRDVEIGTIFTETFAA